VEVHVVETREDELPTGFDFLFSFGRYVWRELLDLPVADG